jgi:hypothetical protein
LNNLPPIDTNLKHDRDYIAKVFREAKVSPIQSSPEFKWDPNETRLTKPINYRKPTEFDTDVREYLLE